jgi:hypothetical protein
MTTNLGSRLHRSVMKEDVLSLYPNVTCTRFFLDRQSEQVEINTPVYNIDKIQQLTFKIAQQLNVSQDDVYLVAMQGNIVLFPHQYGLGLDIAKKQMPIETPAELNKAGTR